VFSRGRFPCARSWPDKCSLRYSTPVRNLTFSLGFREGFFPIAATTISSPNGNSQESAGCCNSRGEALRLTSAVLTVTVVLVTSACSNKGGNNTRIEPVYDQQTGKLQLLRYDSDGDGKIDTWSYMDGARVLRIEMDKDEDGKLDRWEYYGQDQKLERIGSSRANDGKIDTWSYPGPDGAIARIEISTRHDGKMNRTEYYEKGVLVRAEEDSDGDGKLDKWETYENARMASVAFDTTHRGTPDRRLVYGSHGTARVEVDPSGDGHFVAVH
jgi:hypothetical protein